MRLSLSEVDMRRLTMDSSACRMASRSSDMTLSITCASFTIGSNPKKPAAPLMLWTDRKMLFRRLLSVGFDSRAIKSVSRDCRCSLDSCTKRSSIS